jgi:alpha-amylase
MNSMWLPPFSKATNPASNGYDLGDFDQKGSVKTLYGNRAELEKLIQVMREHKVGAIADMVINHSSGADEEETYPLDGKKRWTKFNPKSGKFPRDWNCFHPCRYERTMIAAARILCLYSHFGVVDRSRVKRCLTATLNDRFRVRVLA